MIKGREGGGAGLSQLEGLSRCGAVLQPLPFRDAVYVTLFSTAVETTISEVHKLFALAPHP